MVGIVLLLAQSCLAQDATDADAALRDQIAQLVRQLDSDTLAEREAAERELLQLGTAALDYLPDIDDRAPAEVRLRLERVRTALERSQLEERLEPSRVTLAVEGEPLDEVLAALEGQTGNRVYLRDDGPDAVAGLPDVTCDFQDTPYWEALDTLLDESQLTVYPFTDQPGLALSPRAPSLKPRLETGYYSGPYRFEAIEATANRVLRSTMEGSLNVTYEFSWEPRLRPIAVRQSMSSVVAVVDTGSQLAAATPADFDFPVRANLQALEIELPLTAPPREAREIAKLSGSVDVLLTGPSVEFRFAELDGARDSEQRRAGTSVVLERVRRNNALWEIRVLVRFDSNSAALESHLGWVFSNRAVLAAEDGTTTEPATMETTRQTRNEIGAAYLFNVGDDLDDLSFVYETPVSIVTRRVEYELTDLPLP